MKHIYLDNSATTSISSEVLEIMTAFLKNEYGNPSSLYKIGRDAKKAIESARGVVSKILGAQPSEIYFTSGGTESDNWAIKGAAFAGIKRGKNHIVTTRIEHHAVLNTLKYLEKNGFNVTYLQPDKNGLINALDVEKVITQKTALVSIIYANNEIGTIQPISQIGKICSKNGVIFHTDAVQAVGNLKIDVISEKIDMLSLSAHKFHGPKGVGVLYIRKGVKIENLIEGGAQENGMRAGTENTASIVGLSKAAEIAYENINKKSKKLEKMRDKLIKNLLKIPCSHLNGDREKRLPGNVNISFEGVEGESILLKLDSVGICASSGSACTSGSLDPSHVLLAIGLSHEVAHGSLRLTLDESITEEDIDYVLEKIPIIIENLRNMSPLWEKIKLSQN